MTDVKVPTLNERAMSAVADLFDIDPERGLKAWAILEKTLGARERFDFDKRVAGAKLALAERKLGLDEARFEHVKAMAERKLAPAPAPAPEPRPVRSVVR